MTDKVTLNDITSLTNETSAITTINGNSATIESAFDNTLSLDGTAPNQMSAVLDMNSNRIINLGAPLNLNDAVRLQDVDNISSIVSNAAAIAAAVTTCNTDATNAAASATSAASSATTAGTYVSEILSTPSTFTASFTVSPSTNFAVYIFTGSAANQVVTIQAIGSYANYFTTTLINNGTRAFQVAGLTNTFWVYPGQQVKITDVNSTWYTYPEVVQPLGAALNYYLNTPFRGVMNGSTFYVDGTNGNDLNDGLAAGSGNAWKSVTQCWQFLMGCFDACNINPNIHIASGTYNVVNEPESLGAIFLYGCPPGCHAVAISGSGTLIETTSNMTTMININDGAVIIWNNIEFAANLATSCVGIGAARNVVCDFGNGCTWGTFSGGSALNIQNGAQISFTGNNTIAPGSCITFAEVGPGGYLEFGANTYTCIASVFSGGFVDASGSGATVQIDSGATFSGAGAGSGSTGPLALVSYNASVFGTTVTGVPGSTAVQATNGGVYT